MSTTPTQSLRGPGDKNIGESLVEPKFNANATGYKAIDATVKEPGGKLSVISLGSKYANPEVSDDVYITQVRNELMSKAVSITRNRSFGPKDGFSVHWITPQQVGAKVAAVAIPETRTGILVSPAFINMMMQLRQSFRNVGLVVVPVRGWRP